MSLARWPWRWSGQPWDELAAEYRTLTGEIPQLSPVLAVIESVIENRMQDQLVATTSMHDLVVTTNPPREPPIDVVIVRSTTSMHPSPPGTVAIEHLATNGKTERIVRPDAEVLGLFWRFVAEKFGIQATEPSLGHRARAAIVGRKVTAVHFGPDAVEIQLGAIRVVGFTAPFGIIGCAPVSPTTAPLLIGCEVDEFSVVDGRFVAIDLAEHRVAFPIDSPTAARPASVVVTDPELGLDQATWSW